MDYSRFERIEDSDDDALAGNMPRETRWAHPQPYAIASGSGWNIRSDPSGAPDTPAVNWVQDDTPVSMIGETGSFWILADGSGYARKSHGGIEWRKLSAEEAEELEIAKQERAAKEAEEHAARLAARSRIAIKPAQRSIGPQQLRAVIVPGTSHPGTDVRQGSWYAWLAKRLRAHSAFGEVLIENMPDSMCNDVELWVKFMLRELRCDANTIVIGHSAGTASTMDLLQTHRLWGAVLVASCPGVIPNNDTAWARIRANVGGNVSVLHGSDDPMCPLSYGEHTAEMLNVSLHIEPNVGHFNFLRHECIYDAALRAATVGPSHRCHEDGCPRLCCAGWWYRAQLKSQGTTASK